MKTPTVTSTDAVHVERYLDAILNGDKASAVDAALSRLEHGWSVERIYSDILGPAQRRLGDFWEANRISVAQEHFGSAITQLVMCRLYPVGTLERRRRGLVAVVAAVGDELHEIGIRMFGDLLDMDGWDTYQVGGNVPPSALRAAVLDQDADLVAISATLQRSTPAVAEAIAGLRDDPATARIPILLGGAAFGGDAERAVRLGADAFAADTRQGVEHANRLANMPKA